MTDCFKSKQNPVLFIAEIGGNHEGDFDYAIRLCDLAIASGADAIKFQLYRGDHLVSPVTSPDRNLHFKRFELTKQQHIEIAKRVRDAGRHYMASVWDEELLSWIDPYIDIHKVGSGDLTHYALLKILAETGKPIILSTGLANMDEIRSAVAHIASIDQRYLTERRLALLQCTSAYPTPDEAAHLRVISSLTDAFDLPVGYSDHTLGSGAVDLTYALGARIIEKHFTDTRSGKTFRDHKISLTHDEVAKLLERLCRAEKLLGSCEKALTEAEARDDHHISFRRSLYAKTPIAAGEILGCDNIIALRPKEGICASRYFEVMGLRTRHAIERFHPIREESLVS